MTDIATVIGWKHNHQEGMCTEEGIIVKFPGGIPSAANQATWTTEYEAHLAATAYVAKRKAAYKSLEDQSDMKYWDSVNSTTTWVDHIAKVKSDNPKG